MAKKKSAPQEHNEDTVLDQELDLELELDLDDEAEDEQPEGPKRYFIYKTSRAMIDHCMVLLRGGEEVTTPDQIDLFPRLGIVLVNNREDCQY